MTSAVVFKVACFLVFVLWCLASGGFVRLYSKRWLPPLIVMAAINGVIGWNMPALVSWLWAH